MPSPEPELEMTVLTQTTETVETTEKREGYPVRDRPRELGRFSQFIDYLFWLLYSLLMIRLLLVFFHASAGAGFVRFIDSVTNPFYTPFRGIVASQPIEGGYTLAIPVLVALLVYALLHLAINKLLRVIAYRRAAV
ncbi:MAG: YggT family protein [Gemmatimonadales bacterium]